MRARWKRTSIAAVIVAVLVVPTVGSSAGPTSVARKREKLERVEKRIQRREARAQRLKGYIDELNRHITDTQIELNRINARIDGIERELRSALARIADLQEQIDAIEQDAKTQATELYKTGSTDILDALFNSPSLSTLNDRIELLDIAAEQSAAALVRYGRLQYRIQDEHAAVFRARDRLTDEKSNRQRLQKDRNGYKSLLASQLDKLEKELHVDHEREGDLEAAIARMTGRIQELQAKQSAEGLGTSSYGFIWPLNGGVTSGYGYRWGRMHSGIDIDGYTGQMIVSAKEGRVIMASTYSGYGNSVVVDHGGGYATLYAHLSYYDVAKGEMIEQGEVVGRVGCSGSCTGDHLHFEVRVNGNPRNPMDYLP